MDDPLATLVTIATGKRAMPTNLAATQNQARDVLFFKKVKYFLSSLIMLALIAIPCIIMLLD